MSGLYRVPLLTSKLTSFPFLFRLAILSDRDLPSLDIGLCAGNIVRIPLEAHLDGAVDLPALQ